MNLIKLKQIANRPRSKILIGNFLSLSSLQIVNYLLPLVTLPYLTKVLGVNMFGVLAIAGAVIMYFQTFVDFGFEYSATRDIANNQSNITIVSKILWTVTFTKIILMLISLILLITLILFIHFFRINYLIILLTFLSVPSSILFPEWFYQGMEKMKYITTLNVIAKTIFTVLIFVLIKKPTDYIYQPLLIAFGYFTSGVISVFIMFYHFKIKMYIPSFFEIKTAMVGSFDIFFNNLLPSLYFNLSTLFLALWWGNSVVGIFDAGKKVILLSEQAITVLARTFFPFLANNINKHIYYYKMSLMVGIIFMVLFFFGADLIANILFSKEFVGSIEIIRIMAISPVFFSLMSSFGTNYLILVHKEKTLRNITLTASIIGLIIAVVLIYFFQAKGAALTLVLVWCLRSILCVSYYKKVKLENYLND